MNETELLFTELLNCDRLSLYQNRETLLDKDISRKLSLVLKRRMRGEPLPYILGKIEFMGFDFKVNGGVLIPRPETEVLVETVCKYVAGLQRHQDTRTPGHQVTGCSVLDVGTGSGCIAVSLKKLLPQLRVDAVDISFAALETAKENARSLGAKINFIQSDLFGAAAPACRQAGLYGPAGYDIIVSNPPYIRSRDISFLSAEVKNEPRLALDGGKDGLDYYRRIIVEAPGFLKRAGLLIIEIGFGQKPGVEKIFRDSDKFEIINIVRDYNNIERVVIAKLKEIYG